MSFLVFTSYTIDMNIGIDICPTIRIVLYFILDVVRYTTCVPLQSSNINELRNRIKDVVN